MRILNKILPVVAAVTFLSSALHADCGDCSNNGCKPFYRQELDEKDWQALYDYINTKRTINLQEKSCNLTLAGDVRVDWSHNCEKRCGAEQRGGNARDEDGKRVGKNEIDIELNLYIDYVCDRTWAVAQLELDNCAGTEKFRECRGNDTDEADDECVNSGHALHGSGTSNNLNLKKAYMGYNVCCDGCTRFDIELGRRHLYHVFDSEVQFLSRFDGLLLKYDTCWDCLGDWYVHLGGFVVDTRVNHFAWVIETGLLNIYECGLDVKYSFIDWKKNGTNICDVRNPSGTMFTVNQFTFAYNFDPEMLCMPAKAYGAVLWNGSAEKGTRGNKENFAWYVGFRTGEVVYEGDWAFDAQYQYVEAQAVPDRDMSGIGNGNVNGSSFPDTGYGNTNFKGWRLEALYAFTDNITFDARVQWSREISKKFAGSGKNGYSQFRLEAIYAF